MGSDGAMQWFCYDSRLLPAMMAFPYFVSVSDSNRTPGATNTDNIPPGHHRRSHCRQSSGLLSSRSHLTPHFVFRCGACGLYGTETSGYASFPLALFLAA